MWTSSDVLCCTASILHLVAIAVDRYWAVTNVDYIHTRNGNRIGAMIVVVWAVALIVSLAPQFGWKDPEYLDRINKQQRCLPSQDVGYQIFATCSTFYVPLLVILVLYWKIFQTARKRIHRRQRPRPPPTAPSQVSQQTSNNTPSLQQAGSPGTRAVSRFITKRRFRRITSSSSKKKKSSAAEALVSSLVIVEGGHSTSTSVQDVGAACDDDVANSCGPGPKTTAASEEDEEEPASGEATTAFTISRSLEGGGTMATTSNNVSPEKSSTATTTNNGSASHQSHISDMSRVEILHRDNPPPSTTPASARGVGGVKERLLLAAAAAAGGGAAGAAAACHMQRRDKKESLEAKRERKAAKTLAIITGAFVVCWLPFFIMALLMPLCSACVINDYMASFFLWLGYFNSTLNPVIYTIFSPEFRQAFKRILCGAAGSGRSRNFRPGKLR